MNYWLMKSEPAVFGIDDLARAPKKTAPWWGVRNYQARNFMRDQMKIGDPVFFRHAKAGELAEHVTEYLLVRGDRIEDRAPTYRGLGRCYLG